MFRDWLRWQEMGDDEEARETVERCLESPLTQRFLAAFIRGLQFRIWLETKTALEADRPIENSRGFVRGLRWVIAELEKLQLQREKANDRR